MNKQSDYIKDILIICENSATDRLATLLVERKYHITPKITDLIYPYTSERFMHVWNTMCAEPKWKKKSKLALQLSLKKLSKVSESEAIEMMLQTIECSYQGIFPVNKPKSHVTEKNRERVESLSRILTDPANSNY